VPFIASKYRIEKGPQAIGGASYGGIAALYALLARPDLFSLGLLESPSLAIGNARLLRETEHFFKGRTGVYSVLAEGNQGRSDSPETSGTWRRYARWSVISKPSR
jgi:predicted alpha/beta superfamily hydrolase